MRIHLTSAYPDPEPIGLLRKWAALDRTGVHTVVDDPDAADRILFVENSHYEDDPLYARLRAHPLVRRHPDRCVMYNEHDRPWYVLPGLYASTHRRLHDPRRMLAFSYIRQLNPWVDRLADAPNVAEPTLLYSFAGARTAPVRDRLLTIRDPRAELLDSSTLRPWDRATDRASDPFRSYAERLAASRFVLCPRGVGTGSLRLFETMQMGRVPVILSDDWVPVPGIDWTRFAVFVPEARAAEVGEILRAVEPRWPDMARAARETWRERFAPERIFHHIGELLGTIPMRSSGAERVARAIPTVPELDWQARLRLRPILPALRKVLHRG